MAAGLSPGCKTIIIHRRSTPDSHPGSARVSRPGSARVSRPRRNARPKVSPFTRRPSVGGVARSETGHNHKARSETGHNSGPWFGEGLPTPPKRPTEGLPIHQETFGRRGGSVGDRPQPQGSVGDRPQPRLGRRPATTAAPGSARVSRPRRNARPKVSPYTRRPSVAGVARSETGHNHKARSETGHNHNSGRRPNFLFHQVTRMAEHFGRQRENAHGRFDWPVSCPPLVRIRGARRFRHPGRLRAGLLRDDGEGPAAADRLHARGLCGFRRRRLCPRQRHRRGLRDLLRGRVEPLQFDRRGLCREVARGCDQRGSGPGRAGEQPASAPQGQGFSDPGRRFPAVVRGRGPIKRSQHRFSPHRPRAGTRSAVQAAGLYRAAARPGRTSCRTRRTQYPSVPRRATGTCWPRRWPTRSNGSPPPVVR